MDHRKVDATGIKLLHDPSTNKGTAFTEAERSKFGLNGLIPDALETIETQVERVMMQLSHKHSDIDRFVYLTGLLDTNETLFYRVVMSDPVRFLPIIYDPTIGEACTKFSHIMRRVRGVYLSIAQKGSIADSLSHWPDRDIRFICVTNGGQILGSGILVRTAWASPLVNCSYTPPRAACRQNIYCLSF
nr:hypothetical protein [Microbulbifer variabilis]